jgi:tetratricopeptide (TPR) repeat protein
MDTRLIEQLDNAARELEQGGFQETLRILEETEVESLLTTDFWYLRGFAQRGLEDYAEAADSFATVVTVKPGEVAAHALAADSFVRCQRLGAAEQHLLSGLAANPHSTDLLEVYCFACARGGQTEKARALLKRLLERDPGNEAAFRLRILIEFVEGSDEGLYQATRQYLDELPDTPENALATGKAMLDGGRISGALRCFSEALQQDPTLRDRHPDFFEELSVLKSPLLFPCRLLDRYGRWLPWAVGAVTMLALQSLHFAAGAVFAGVFALFLLYTWVAPPLVRRALLGHW